MKAYKQKHNIIGTHKDRKSSRKYYDAYCNKVENNKTYIILKEY